MATKINNVGIITIFGQIGKDKDNQVFFYKKDFDLIQIERNITDLFVQNAGVSMRGVTNISMTPLTCTMIEEEHYKYEKSVRCAEDISEQKTVLGRNIMVNLHAEPKRRGRPPTKIDIPPSFVEPKKRGRPRKISPEDDADAFFSEKDRLRKKLD